ncbi:CDP-alcohol phosphatidyltransferase family protein [Pseudonocardia humida]|uniref:CDP-alcohol phosphatidyltransferase family protein n=1 Tax=Pseudonocardia humida TaxID=2800819 RepID=A0ABT1AAR5_9PSEU|nr:CDP-alcohol phosphatidyltransferase family protein [Pseudonocardia humida]MCO1660130.1 CDP-alcohol phosphatidyltransferase family protein [Pseudonocardia humida]
MEPGGVRGWSDLHGGVEVSGPARVWLRGVQRLAAVGPVARIPPDALTAAGLLSTAGALAAAVAGGRWALLSVLLVVLAGVLDGLDGAVALRSGRARPLGAVLDATADRVGDLLLAAVLAVLGAPPPWCAAAAALVLLHEYVRARAQAAGMPGAGAVTVAERPTRIILVAVAALGAGALPAGTPLTGWDWATVCAVAWVVVGAVGLVHLAVGVVRHVPAAFPGQAGPTSPDTISADSATSGNPPPGCAEPPTR